MAIRSVFRIFVDVVLLMTLAACVLSAQERDTLPFVPDEVCKQPFISMCISFGTETFGGGPGEVFNTGFAGGLGLGGRYRGVTFMATLQIFGVQDIDSRFVSQTQWKEESLASTGSNLLFEFGYQFRRSPKLWIEPFIGVRLTAIGSSKLDPYTNWDWGQTTDIGPTAGSRIKWRTAGRKERHGVGYLFAEVRLSLLRFGEGELGNGYSLQILIGYGGDRP